MSKHHANFTWGAGPNSVHVAGGWNNWSATASPLQKQADGSFKGEVPMPWGEKQAFKYVVDGEWKVREDEAKEWDAAGNMNNVYTAPHAPAAPEPATAAPAPAAVAAAPAAAAPSAPASPEVKREAAPAPAPEPADVPAITKAEPSNLLASTTPAAASSGPTGQFFLGNPLGATSGSTTLPPLIPSTTAAHHTLPPLVPASAAATTVQPATQPTPTGPATQEKIISKAEQIEKVAAKSPVGEAATGPHEDTILEKATAVGASAFATLGTYVGVAATAVEKATGIDLTHGAPLSIQEAKAAGLDLNTIEKRDAPTDATSPVNTKPSAAAVDDLSSKIQDLKVGSMPTHKEPDAAPKNDIPAQNEMASNHKTVPMPVITDLTEKDPKKDRALTGSSSVDTAGTKPISADPSVSAKAAKEDAEANPRLTGSTPHHAHATNGTASVPVAGAAATGPLPAGSAAAAPDRPSTNFDAPSPPRKDTSGINTAATTSKGAAPQPAATASAPAVVPSAAPAPAVVPAATPAPAAAAPPTTPAKSAHTAPNGLHNLASPGSLNSTPASTPVKPTAHKKEDTGASDVRKRKSSFFHKIKSKFSSPKDEKK